MQKISFNVTQSEKELGGTISRALNGSGYTINRRTKAESIIGIQEKDTIEKNDKKAFNNAEFDYVVLDRDGYPVFVVEYDGPCHEKPEKKRSDARKNAWCADAQLPLLRVSDWAITKEDQDLFITYLIKRHIAYREERPLIINEIEKRYGQEEIDRCYAEGLIPWDMDPYRVFDLNYPFPDLYYMLEKIARDFKIFVLYQPPTKALLLEKRTAAGLRLIPVELATETEKIEYGKPGLARCIINGVRLYGEQEGTKTVFSCWWYIIKSSGAKSSGYNFSGDGGPISVSGGYEIIKQNVVSLTLDTTLPLGRNPEPTTNDIHECARKDPDIARVYAGLPGSEFFFVSNIFTCYLASKAAYDWFSENGSIWKGEQ